MTETLLTDEDRWRIALAKDRRFDGQFVTGVHSTGIYCRPSCPARPPKRANVRFYASPAEAEAAGLRACLRCKPRDVARDEAAVRAAIDEIRSDGSASLDALAGLTGYSPAHFQRLFTRATGLSPAAYARALREERARKALTGGERVTDAIYDAGYESPSRFYEAMEGKMGMAPSAWVAGGRGETIHWAVVGTTLGPMLVAATAKGVCRLSFEEGPAELARRFPNAELVEGGEDFEKLLARGRRRRSKARALSRTSRSTCKGPRSRNAAGRRCAKSRRARPAPMPRSPRRRAIRKRCARRGAPTRATTSRC